MNEPQPSLRPTRPLDLLGGLLLGAGVAGIVRLVRGDAALTDLPSSVAVTIGLLGLAEVVAAASVRARREGRPRTRPIMPMTVARTAALARASSLTGAVLAGVWAVVLADRLSRVADVDAAQHDAIVAGAGVATALLLVVAALRLEGVCRADPPAPPGADGDARP
ncbi:MAG TPA: DUF3180 domain-containing protein [Mycobacteriales bacterium]|nr:DUF3180 domain-containing protein [Mycobacteriales bacterium]